MERFFAILCEGVHRFEGTVDQFTGDGIMALFGAPIAHEDHAQRACYAALHLQRGAGRLRGASCAASRGSASRSGWASTRARWSSARSARTCAWTTPRSATPSGLAQRMEQLAEPGKAYLTEHTAALVEGYLELADLGEFQVKGASQPLRGPRAGRRRRGPRPPRRLARARLLALRRPRATSCGCSRRARSRRSPARRQVIGIVGEAGVGKSRLCHEFAERCRARGIPVYQTSGQAHADVDPAAADPAACCARTSTIDRADSDQTRARADRRQAPAAGRELRRGPAADLRLPRGRPTPSARAADGPRGAPAPAARADQAAHPRAERPRARRHAVRGPALVRPGERGVPGQPRRGGPGHARPDDPQLPARVPAPSGCRSPTTARSPWPRSAPRRSSSCSPTCSARTRRSTGCADLVRERTAGNPFFIEEIVRSLVEAGNLEGERGAYRLVAPGRRRPRCRRACRRSSSARIDRLARAREGRAAGGGGDRQGVLATGPRARRPRCEPAALDDGAARPGRGRVRLRAGALPGVGLRVHAPAHPGGRLRLAARRAPGRRPRRGRRGRSSSSTPERLDERAALLASTGRAPDEPLEAARWHARAGAWVGTTDPTAGAATTGARSGSWPTRCPTSEETAALGLSARIFALQLRMAARASPTRRPRRSSLKPSAWPRRHGTPGR